MNTIAFGDPTTAVSGGVPVRSSPDFRETEPHPITILAQSGVNDAMFAAALFVSASLSFNVQLAYFRVLAGYSLRYDGVTWPDLLLNKWMIPAALAATMSIVLFVRPALRRRRVQNELAGQTNAPAPSAIERKGSARVEELSARAGLAVAPALSVNASPRLPYAQVDRIGVRARIVVGGRLLTLLLTDPPAADALLAHEISHVEVDDMRMITLFRRMAWLYVGAVATVGFAGLGLFLFRRYEMAWIDSMVALYGRLFFCLISAFVPFLYARQFLVQREFLHDRRAAQLTRDDGLALRRLFETLAEFERGVGFSQRLRSRCSHFLRFHPLPSSRLKVLRDPYPYSFDTVVYPFAVGLLLPLLSVLVWFLLGDFGQIAGKAVPPIVASLVSAAIFAVSVLAMLAADIARFAALAARRALALWTVVRYIVMVFSGSIVSIVPILTLPSARPNASAISEFIYVLAGAAWFGLAQAGLTTALTYAWAVQESCVLVGWRRRLAAHFRWPLALLVILCFQALSSSRGFTGAALMLWLIVTLICVGLAVGMPIAINAVRSKRAAPRHSLAALTLHGAAEAWTDFPVQKSVAPMGHPTIRRFMSVTLAVILAAFFLCPTAIALAWANHTRHVEDARRQDLARHSAEVYKAVTVYALARAMNDEGSLTLARMRDALKSGFGEAGQFYGVDEPSIKELFRNGGESLLDRGEDDNPSLLLPLVRRATDLAGGPPQFKDCVRAVRELGGGGNGSTPRPGNDDRGPRAVG